MKKQYTMADCMATIQQYGCRQFKAGQAKAYKECSDMLQNWCDELESAVMGCKADEALFVTHSMYATLIEMAENFEQLSAIAEA